MNTLLHFLEQIRIRSFKRFIAFTTTYPGFLCYVIDKSSFLYMYSEIFEKEIYKFESKAKQPFIIDCGANIGLQIVYFKRRFPDAKILAFEPDPSIFEILEKNISSAGVNSDVTCIQACLAKKEGEVSFYPDGSDGGSIVHNNNNAEAIKVPAHNLKTFITEPVTFLKIDIEGAEFEVLESIIDKLHLVENIFIEYHSMINKTQNLDQILLILKNAGFRYYIEHGGIYSPEPYIKRNTDHEMDLQLNIYFYRDSTKKIS